MDIPSFTINSKSVQGKPAISYSPTVSKNCTSWEDVLSKSETTLKFGALSSFACLTLDDMSKTLPEFKFVAATDGLAFFSYRGKETAPAMYSSLLDSEENREVFREYAAKWCGSFDSIFQKYAEDKNNLP
jgi:hypothetical protein